MREIPGRGYLFSVLLFLVIFSPAGNFAQQRKIIKVIDTNLFMLEDSSLVKLAGVEVPRKDIPGKNMNNLAQDILQFAGNYFLNRKLDIIPAGLDAEDSTIKLVYFVRRFDLGSADYNLRYLELGYAKFRDNVDSLHRSEYKETEAGAIKGKYGMWSFRLPEVEDNLDRKYYSFEISYLSQKDSLNEIEFLRKRGAPIAFLVAWQTCSGILVGGLGSLATGLVAGSMFNPGGEYGGLVSGFFGMMAGYMVMAPLGVYWAAKPNNPSLSYGYTLGFSTLSTIAGIGIALLGPQDHNNQLWVIPALMPLVGPLIYVNLITPNPVLTRPDNTKMHTFKQDFSGFRNVAFKDIYNNSMQINISVFRIPL